MRDLRNEFDIEAPRCKGAYLEDAPTEIFDGQWVLEPKMDGIRSTLQIGAKRSMLVGRNREDFLKGVEKAGPFRCQDALNPKLVKSVMSAALHGTVLDGELTECFKQNGEYDKDTQKRVDNGDFVGYRCWGVLFYAGMDVRHLPEEVRYHIASLTVAVLDHPKIEMVPRMPCTKNQLYAFLDAGIEGVVVKLRYAAIPKNQRTNPYWWKVKGTAKRTVDAFITDVTQAKEGGSMVNGVPPQLVLKAAGFEVSMLDKMGNIVKVGTLENIPQKARDEAWTNFEKYYHRVVEMQVSGFDGEWFRFCRFAKWRPDKGIGDCRFDEQIGKVVKKADKIRAK